MHVKNNTLSSEAVGRGNTKCAAPNIESGNSSREAPGFELDRDVTDSNKVKAAAQGERRNANKGCTEAADA